MLLLAGVVNKYPSNGPTTPSGWTLVGQFSGGSGAAGADVGSVYVTIYSKPSDGTKTGTQTISVPSGNSSLARICAYSCAAGAAWGVAAFGGADSTAGT